MRTPKITRKPFLTRESQHCHILALPEIKSENNHLTG